jgi:DNA polymerase-3 subunit epsilon
MDGYSHLRERVYNILEQAGTPQPATAFLEAVFGASAGAPAARELLARLLEEQLAQDSRFVRQADGRWGLRAWTLQESGLRAIEYVILHVQTTGPRPERHRISEVAAVRLREGRPAETFTTVVNPGRTIPRYAREYSGLSEERVEHAPQLAEILDELRAFVADALPVGHNLPRHLAFLSYETAWHGRSPFAGMGIDTVAVATRLFPRLKQPTVERLCRKLGVQPPGSRRALDIARALARAWDRLLDLLVMEGLHSVGELLAWLGTAPGRTLQTALESLPDAPGVYYLTDASGEVLYVGKARNLRRRVPAHFRQASAYLHGADGLPEQTAAITFQQTGSEFEALLLEAREIDRLQPRYNVQRVVRQRHPYIRVDRGPFPRAVPASEIYADGALYFGPYRSGAAVRELLEALHDVFHLASCRRTLPPRPQRRPKPPCIRLGMGLCPAPCTGLLPVEAYAPNVAAALAFLREGPDAPAVQAFLSPPQRMALPRHRPLDGTLAGADVVLVYPAAEPGHADLYFVRSGRLLHQERVARTQPLDHAHLAELIARVFAQAPLPRHHISPQELRDVRVILHWLAWHQGEPEIIPVSSPGEAACAVACALGWSGLSVKAAG